MIELVAMPILFIILVVLTYMGIKDYVAEKEKDEKSEATKNCKLAAMFFSISTSCCGVLVIENICGYFNSAD